MFVVHISFKVQHELTWNFSEKESMQNDLFFILYHGVWNNLRSRMIFVDDELESLSDIFGALDEVSNSSSATGRSMFYGANILLGYTSLNELLFWVSPSSATSRRRGHVVSNLPMLTKEAEGQKTADGGENIKTNEHFDLVFFQRLEWVQGERRWPDFKASQVLHIKKEWRF